MDDTFKRANLKTSEAHELDAQAKATGTQIMFVDDIVDESGERVNAEYSDGVLRISLKAKNPV